MSVKPGTQIALISCFVFVTLAVGLGSATGARHHDEGWYLSIISEMEQSGDWSTPRLHGEPTYIKPPLMYWLALLARAVLGHSLFAARLPSALFAALTVFATYWIARELHSQRTATTAAWLLASSFGLQAFGHLALFESGMMCAVALAVLGALWSRRSPAWLLLTGVGLTVSAMLKWPAVALVPLGAAAVTVAATRQWQFVKWPWAMVALALPFAALAPWAIAHWHQPQFQTDVQLYNVGLVSNARSAPFALFGIFLHPLPWTPAFAWAITASLHQAYRQTALVRTMLGWTAIATAFWLLPSQSYLRYSLPALPACCVLTARMLETPSPKWLTRLTACLLGLGAVVLLIAFRLAANASTVVALVVAVAALSAAAWSVLHARWNRTGAFLAVGFAAIWGVAFPSFSEEYLPSHVQGALAGRNLFVYGPRPGYYAMLLDKPVGTAFDEAHVTNLLQSGATVILDLEASGFPEPATPHGTTEVVRWRRLKSRISPSELLRALQTGSIDNLHRTLRAVALQTEPPDNPLR